MIYNNKLLEIDEIKYFWVPDDDLNKWDGKGKKSWYIRYSDRNKQQCTIYTLFAIRNWADYNRLNLQGLFLIQFLNRTIRIMLLSMKLKLLFLEITEKLFSKFSFGHVQNFEVSCTSFSHFLSSLSC